MGVLSFLVSQQTQQQPVPSAMMSVSKPKKRQLPLNYHPSHTEIENRATNKSSQVKWVFIWMWLFFLYVLYQWLLYDSWPDEGTM